MASDRIKLCFVLPSLAGGGAERAAVHILNALDPASWDKTMYLFDRQGPYLAEVSSSVRIVSGDRASRSGRWRSLRQFVRSTRPQLVVSFLSYFTVLTAVRAAAVGARVVFNQQTPMSAFLTDADYAWRRRWHRAAFTAVARAGYAAVDRVIATSRGVADDLVSHFGARPSTIRVLPNPVDLERVRAAAVEPLEASDLGRWHRPVIVAAGRLADAKNYPLLIDAMARLRARVPARLFILGQGEREAELREMIHAHNLDETIVLCGFQPNPWKYIARADLFVLTSRYEGFGNVLIEAMACGVPVVATASPGTRDIVNSGVDGLLVEAHTPAAVADAMAHVLDDAAIGERMARAARTSAERFSLPATVSAYDAVLREAVA